MNGPTAAVVIFFLLMCVERLLLSLTPFFGMTHTCMHACAHTHTQSKKNAKSTAAACEVTPPGYKSQGSCALRRIIGPALTNPPETGPVCTRRR